MKAAVYRGAAGLTERLQKFEASQAGEHPDWRAIGTALREAPEEWRQLGPVEREAFKAIQAEFNAALGRLRTRLEGWQAQNASAKEAFIRFGRGMQVTCTGPALPCSEGSCRSALFSERRK